MKLFQVLCLINQNDTKNIQRVEVDALDEADAKAVALKCLREKAGFPNAVIMPETDGYQIVREVKRYGVMCFTEAGNYGTLTNVEVTAADVEDAKRETLRQLARAGYPNAAIAPELPGMPGMAVMELS